MINFVYRTDVHLSDRSPISWKGDYPNEIWGNLIQVGRIARDYEARAVLDGGDYFHQKSASKNPHAIVAETARVHREYPCPTYSVEGNHDMVYNLLDSIPKQPLGVLYESGVFGHLRDETFEDRGIKVRIVGVPYSSNRTVEDLLAIQKRPGDDFLVAIVHSLAGEDPPAKVTEFFNEPVFRYSQITSKDGPDVFCFGHWHKDQGVVEVNGKKFVNLGALSRGALTNENIHRTPKAAILQFSPGNIQIVPVSMNVAPPEEVFDMERKERQEREHHDIDLFISKLQTDAAFDPSLSIEDNVRSLGSFAEDVRNLALNYLDQARAEVG